MRPLVAAAALVVAVLAVLFIPARAEVQALRNDGPISALIVRQGIFSRGGVGKFEALQIVDPEKVATLESFFPNYRQRPTSRVAGGWMTGYVVYFNFPSGESVRVTVSENQNAAYWTVGRGDFDTRGDFKAFVEAVQKQAETAETTGPGHE